VHALASALLELLAPASCAGCDRRGVDLFCARCVATLRTCPVPTDPGPVPIHGRLVYTGALAEAIRRLKYSDRPDLARPLGRLLAAAAAGLGDEAPGDLVVPVPLHPRRLAERGYNQAALLARPVARALALPFVTGELRRLVNTNAQARLGGHERRANVAGAFAASEAVRGRRVLLVDDVATTGATLLACGSALRERGASGVVALVLARAEEDPDDLREP
jgi:ComF family protein